MKDFRVQRRTSPDIVSMGGLLCNTDQTSTITSKPKDVRLYSLDIQCYEETFQAGPSENVTTSPSGTSNSSLATSLVFPKADVRYNGKHQTSTYGIKLLKFNGIYVYLY